MRFFSQEDKDIYNEFTSAAIWIKRFKDIDKNKELTLSQCIDIIKSIDYFLHDLSWQLEDDFENIKKWIKAEAGGCFKVARRAYTTCENLLTQDDRQLEWVSKIFNLIIERSSKLDLEEAKHYAAARSWSSPVSPRNKGTSSN